MQFSLRAFSTLFSRVGRASVAPNVRPHIRLISITAQVYSLWITRKSPLSHGTSF